MFSDCPIDIGKESELAFLEQSSRYGWTRGSSSSACEVAAPVNRLYPGHCRLESCQTCCHIAVDMRQLRLLLRRSNLLLLLCFLYFEEGKLICCLVQEA